MSAALTEESIIRFIRRRLGEPVVCVELDDEQIIEIIEQALGIYGTSKPVEKFGSIDVTAGIQKYDLTASQVGRGIIEEFRPDLLRHPISLDQFDVFKYHTFTPNLDPGDFYLERIWWKEVRRSAGSDDDWDFILDPVTGGGVLYLSPIPSTSFKWNYIYVVDPTLAEVPPTDDDWIKEYTLAMSMETLGYIRRKFTDIQGAETTMNMDGEQLVTEGSEKRKELEEYLAGRGQIIAPIRG